MLNFESYIDRLESILVQFNRISELLTYEEVLLDKKLFIKLSKDKQLFEPIVNLYTEYLELLDFIKDIEKDINTSQDDLNGFKTKLTDIKKDLLRKLIKLDSSMQKILIEVHASNDELSEILSKDIIRAYTLFCFNNNLTYKITEEGLIKKIYINGIGANDIFEHEVGRHKIIKDGKESTCNIFVYSDIENNEVYFDEKDLVIKTYRSSGAGGQHINTTDSAIKITHVPTGISASSQEERSQFQNREIALTRLKNKVIEYFQKKQKLIIDKQNKEQVKLNKDAFSIKNYYYDENVIIGKNKNTIKLKDFLEGKAIL